MVKRSPKSRQKPPSTGKKRSPRSGRGAGDAHAQSTSKRSSKSSTNKRHDDHRTSRQTMSTQNDSAAVSKPVFEGELVYGKHSVKAVLLKRPGSVHQLVLAGKEEYHADLVQLAKKNAITIQRLTWPEFTAAGSFKEDEKHQGVFVHTAPRVIYDEGDFPRLADAQCLLVLDQVSNAPQSHRCETGNELLRVARPDQGLAGRESQGPGRWHPSPVFENPH